MKIKELDTITFDDNKKYIVLSKISYNEKTYYYLNEYNNITNVLICYEDGNELVDEINDDILKKLLPLFFKNMKTSIQNLD